MITANTCHYNIAGDDDSEDEWQSSSDNEDHDYPSSTGSEDCSYTTEEEHSTNAKKATIQKHTTDHLVFMNSTGKPKR